MVDTCNLAEQKREKEKKLRVKKKKRTFSSLTAWEANARLCVETKSGKDVWRKGVGLAKLYLYEAILL